MWADRAWAGGAGVPSEPAWLDEAQGSHAACRPRRARLPLTATSWQRSLRIRPAMFAKLKHHFKAARPGGHFLSERPEKCAPMAGGSSVTFSQMSAKQLESDPNCSCSRPTLSGKPKNNWNLTPIVRQMFHVKQHVDSSRSYTLLPLHTTRPPGLAFPTTRLSSAQSSSFWRSPAPATWPC